MKHSDVIPFLRNLGVAASAVLRRPRPLTSLCSLPDVIAGGTDSARRLISDISCLDGPAACGEAEEGGGCYIPFAGAAPAAGQRVFHRLFIISGIGNGSRHEGEKIGKKVEREAGVGGRSLPRPFTPSAACPSGGGGQGEGVWDGGGQGPALNPLLPTCLTFLSEVT